MRIPERASRRLDIDTPIIQAPMAGGTTTPELVAAVANSPFRLPTKIMK